MPNPILYTMPVPTYRSVKGFLLFLSGLPMLMGLGACGPLWDSPTPTATTRFVKFFGGSSPDTTLGVAQIGDNYYLLGTSYSLGADSADVMLIQTNNQGDELNRIYWGGAGIQRAAFLVQLSSDQLLLGINRPDSTPVVMLVDANLTILETRELGQGKGTYSLVSGIQLADGSLVVAGGTQEVDSLKNQQTDAPAIRDPRDIWITGLDGGLTPLWSRLYGFTGADEGLALAPNGTGFLLLTRTHFPATESEADAMLVQLDVQGLLLDQVILETEGDFKTGALAQGAAGGWMVALNSGAEGQLLQRNQASFAQVSADLKTIVIRATSEVQEVGALLPLADGSYLVWGTTAGRRTLLLTQLTAEAVLASGNRREFGSDDYQHLPDGIVLLPEGSLLLGATLGVGQGNSVMTLIRTDSPLALP